MPAQILHTLFGEAVIGETYTRLMPIDPGFSLLSKVLEQIRGKNRAVFALGCQGPDIFYHSQMTKPAALEYGALLHRRGFGDFTAALLAEALPKARCGEQEVSPLGIYALGFMTHAMLDRVCHPYIVYKSTIPKSDTKRSARFAQIFQKGTAHAFFERILDVLMLNFLTGESVHSWDQNALAQVCGNPPTGLTALLFQTLRTAFPERAGRDEKLFQRISNALEDCAAFYYLTDPEITSLVKREAAFWDFPIAYLYPEQLPLHIDYLNLGHQQWFYPGPPEAEYTDSFLEIYHTALQTGGDTYAYVLLPYFETGAFLLETAAQGLGNQGLSIQDETGKPCSPVRTDPLPLDEILLQQRTLRDFYSADPTL
ncbi:MAG: zinc dependent phospholipase C family protein [Treponema sp.]|jgi:hypothetical protein|nr:zinc dependent phospholipase C family protein [Treponema sp.]